MRYKFANGTSWTVPAGMSNRGILNKLNGLVRKHGAITGSAKPSIPCALARA